MLLPLLGYSVNWVGWADWLRPWFPYFLAPFLLYLTWKVAVSWGEDQRSYYQGQ